jgi:hypothetical protein
VLKLGVIVVVVTSLALLSGCGSDKKDAESAATTTTVKAPTKAAFIAEADKRCSAAQAESNALPIDANQAATDLAPELIAQVVPIQRQLMEDLTEMTPPAGDETEVAGIFASVTEVIDNWEEALSRDPDAALSTDPFADVNKAAAAYGFKACAE